MWLKKFVLIVFLFIFSSFIPTHGQPKKKPSARESSTVHHAVYRKHTLCGPFLDVLSKRKANKLRGILDREDLTKREIDKAVVQWVKKQNEEIQEKYSSFKRALKVRMLRLKLKHELKIKNFSEEAKKLDENIQNVIEDQDLTWEETCKKKNDLLRKASSKAVNELGLRVEKCDEKRPESESAEYTEGSNEERANPMDYTNHHGNGAFDYQGGHGFDYHENDGRPGRAKSGGRKSSAREHQDGGFDYRNQDYEMNGGS